MKHGFCIASSVEEIQKVKTLAKQRKIKDN